MRKSLKNNAKQAIDKALSHYAHYDLADLFLEYFNNFLSVEYFAEFHGLSLEQAQLVIELGRKAHEERVKK